MNPMAVFEIPDRQLALRVDRLVTVIGECLRLGIEQDARLAEGGV
jgi:hypothetical protein